MKKRLAILLTLVLALGAAAGCSGGPEDTSTDSGGSAAAEAGEQETEEQPSSDREEFDFQELTVLDTEQCTVKITAVGMETDEYSGEETFTMTVSMENKSADQSYRVQMSELAVNGLVMTPMFYGGEVLPQKKANEKAEISMEELNELGVTEITDVDASFSVENTSDYSIAAWQNVHVYPYGEEKAAAYTREAQDTDVVFADTELLKGTVVSCSLESDYSFPGDEVWVAELFLQNPTDQNILYTFSDTSVNGIMAEPHMNFVDSIFIPAGECGYFPLEWEKQTFEENGIEAIENLGFVCGMESYNRQNKSLVDDREPLGEETISVNLK